jgi:cold shock CspA family protein
MPIGQIKKLHMETSLGVILQTDDGQELLFQAASLVQGTFDRLSEGQTVEFDLRPYRNSPGKSRAINVRPVIN